MTEDVKSILIKSQDFHSISIPPKLAERLGRWAKTCWYNRQQELHLSQLCLGLCQPHNMEETLLSQPCHYFHCLFTWKTNLWLQMGQKCQDSLDGITGVFRRTTLLIQKCPPLLRIHKWWKECDCVFNYSGPFYLHVTRSRIGMKVQHL